MMESELKNQNDLLQQLKSLRAEKELLEKHVFVLNECLSVEELKAKISNLEKKKEMLGSLENVIGRLRAEIEPLKYLKSILKTKLSDENKIQSSNIGSELCTNLEVCAEIEPLKYLKTKPDVENKIQTNNVGSELSIDLEANVPKFDMEFCNNTSIDVQVAQPVESKTFISQSTQNIPTESDTIDLVSYPKLPMSSKSNSVSTKNDGSLDECMQLLDQYDVVTDQEILNFPTEDNILKSQSVNQESINTDIDNKVQNTQKATTSTHFDAEIINTLTKDQVPIEKDVKFDLKNLIDLGFGTFKLDEASTSQPTLNKESLRSDANANIGDLLLKIPQLLLQQGMHYIQVEEESKKNFNGNTNVPPKENNKLNKENKLKNEVNKFLNDYTNLLQSSSQTIKNDNVCSKQAESSQHNELSANTSNSECSISSFNDMNLKIDILRGIYSLGFVSPTTLQKRTIVHCLNGRDIIVFAQPGNGRTMMFTIPLLQRIKTNLNECQALVLVPTRDLAVHIQKIIMSIGDFLGVNICIGGDNVPKKLSVIPHIIVGTPLGVSNMITCKSLRTGCIQTVVINKAEKMLSNNYIKLIEEIMKKLTKTRQVTILTSDSLDHVLDIYMETLRDPLVIINDKEKDNDLLKNLPKQFYLNIQNEWKMNALCEINETFKMQKSIIFCNTLDRAQKLCNSLQRLEYAVSLFHLEMNAHEREQILDMFSSDNLKILITTDPIKGSQFQQAAWIVNYDMPINPICYLDRVTKCNDNIKLINFISENDELIKSTIETHNKSCMIPMPLNMIDLLNYFSS
ncbi:probable ATP-dependent RNA helicase DDX6 [Aphis gossypii]|uniref:probable ATP-dependent RNA helicase DDX6 n=1 Tax=Aphis gossypii TaxID=80765 RepID=UPI00215994EC|nr:probable ATP-dependent RNA helicase DDX6 [Aphis gossypii]XP_050059484.1 probable ATP-dependent RNA helicase DDX6 [Aphis gossypii]XP_050059485.1 probable ATP-dependent RNA helicase DDX6 [Aphis gossypii]